MSATLPSASRKYTPTREGRSRSLRGAGHPAGDDEKEPRSGRAAAAPESSGNLISRTRQGRLPRCVATRRVELGVTVVLTDQVAAAVLDAETARLELRVPLVWVGRPTTVRAEVVLQAPSLGPPTAGGLGSGGAA